RVHAIRYITGDVRGPNGADPHIAQGPDQLWFVPGIEGDRIDQFGRTACRAFFDLRMSLCDFSGLDERIGHMCDEVPAANGDPLRRNDIRAADRIDLRTCTMKSPPAQREINKAFSVIIVHMREENSVQLFSPYPELR